MFNEELHLDKALNWGMVGGGRGSQIGFIHRNSALRSRLFNLVAGSFDIVEERGREFGENWGVAADRCYPDYKTMFEEEAKREDGIQAVTIATPNFLHYEICKAALNAGLHVVCEKPLCFTAAEADELVALAKEKNRVVGVTYGYTGAPMIHQAREMIAHGELGEIRIINMQFAHGYHNVAVEEHDEGTKWRVDPRKSGPTYVLGDVGTHALYLAECMIPDLKIDNLMCARQSFVKSRAPLEDNAVVLLNFTNGAFGNLWASGVNTGSTHQQKIRVVGSKGSLEWWDEHPNQLIFSPSGAPVQVLDRGQGYLYNEDDLVNNNRMGGGHAEGLFEAWVTLYTRFGQAMDKVNKGADVSEVMENFWFPSIIDGAKGVHFIEACVESADNGSKWVEYK